MIPIDDPAKKHNGFALFALGFRPFFLFAAISALVLILLWVPYFSGHLQLLRYFAPNYWHAHEMLFGYTLAVIAGFLLTAVRNWTSMATPQGWPLALLWLVWLAGRLLCSLPLGLPDTAIAVIDLSFIPLLMLALAKPLIQAGKIRNLIFLLILTAFWLANLMMHLQALGYAQLAPQGISLALNLVMLMIVIIGGRVIPFFTRNPLPGMQPRINPVIEQASVLSVLLLTLLELWQAPFLLVSTLAFVAGLLHLLRLSGWYDRRIWSLPILWVLHVAYALLAVSLILKGLAPFHWFTGSAATHCFTVGAIGMMTFGMMARVALGHSGRPLALPQRTAWGVPLLLIATLLRVAAGFNLFSGYFLELISAAAVCWGLAFLLFLSNYSAVLCRPRLDGRPD